MSYKYIVNQLVLRLFFFLSDQCEMNVMNKNSIYGHFKSKVQTNLSQKTDKNSYFLGFIFSSSGLK